MNRTRTFWFAALAALTLVVASETVQAGPGHRHHHHGSRVQFGVTFGAPFWYPGPYYYPAYPIYSYPYPAPVVVQAPPRVYVERDSNAAAPEPAASSPFWYFCRESNTYYPYVRECASEWERVPARPTTAR